jgi:hypothetical protein
MNPRQYHELERQADVIEQAVIDKAEHDSYIHGMKDMKNELQLSLIELNDIYYALNTTSKDTSVYGHERMKLLADKVNEQMLAEGKRLDEVKEQYVDFKIREQLK